MPLHFNDCVLFLTPRSPFARRVRVAFIENGISFTEKMVDVFKPTSDILDVNPLGRVPTVRLSTGQILIESHLILKAFYRSIQSDFAPADLVGELEMDYWAGIATGIMDKSIEYYLDSLRPKEHQDEEVRVELENTLKNALPIVENKVFKMQNFLCKNLLTQADFDFSIALDYLSFRYSNQWQTQYPRTVAYLEKMRIRTSFQKTKPQ